MASGRRFDENMAASIFDFKVDYDAMRNSDYVRRRSGLAPNGGGADYHIRNETEYLRLIELSRSLCQNATIIGKSIEKAATNIIGDGFTLCPETGDKDVNDLMFRKWAEWTTNRDLCDIAGEASWSEMEETAVISCIRDGDIIGIGTESGALQMIEAHQCRNPQRNRWNKTQNIVNGVEINEYRKRIRYHIRPESTDPYKTTQQKKSTAYQVRDKNGVRVLFHFFVSDRVTATRGVTGLAPCFQRIAMFDDLDFAKLVQAQALSCIVAQRLRDKTVPAQMPTKMASLGATSQSTQNDGSSVEITQVSPGTSLTPNPGEKIEAFSPDIPNTNYFEHAKMLLTMFFLNIGLPYVMGMMDAAETNFSGWRAAVEEAKKGFKRTQKQLRDKWHKPIYIWRIHWLIASDPEVAAAYEKVGDKIFNHRWRMPRWPYIQPVEDATAKVVRQANMLASPSRIHGEESQDWEEEVDQTINDIAYAIKQAIKKAEEITEEFKLDPPLHWRELLNLPIPNGLKLMVTTAADSNPQLTGDTSGSNT